MKPEAQQTKDWIKVFNLIPGVEGHERIENKIGNGTPDFAYCIEGVHGWIEFKVHPAPKRSTGKIGKIQHWKGMQREWMQKRYTSPTVFLVLRIGDRDYILNTHVMFSFEEMSLWELQQQAYSVAVNSEITKFDALRKIFRGGYHKPLEEKNEH